MKKTPDHRHSLPATKAIASPGPAIGRMLAEARRHHEHGQLAEAEQLYRSILALEPNQFGAAQLLALVLLQHGDVTDAEQQINLAIVINPTSAAAHHIRGNVLQRLNRLEEALSSYDQAIALKANFAEAFNNRGNVLQRLNRFSEAVASYDRAIEHKPGHGDAFNNRGNALLALGHLDEAERMFDKAIELTPTDYLMYYNRATLRRQTRQNNHIVELERLLSKPLQNPMGEVRLCYALAKELEDVGESVRSFEHLNRGANAHRRMLTYSVEDDISAMAELERTFTPELIVAKKTGCEDSRPIFVLGLPRSGTTLVDRILSSHSKIASLGETGEFELALAHINGGEPNAIGKTSALDFAALGRRYSETVAALDPGSNHVVDKTPLNFLHLGLIALSLPNAKIVHLRRQSMDVCYAMYKTLFYRMSYPFSYDLSDLARYYLAYDKLMAHWRKVLPERFIELNYEDLVKNQEAVTRRLIGYCGVEWQDACLAFERNQSPSLTASAAQVRQPIHDRSVGLWRRYTHQLAPLWDALRLGGLDVGLA